MNIPSGHLEGNANDADSIDRVTVLGSGFEANMPGGDFRLLVEAVAETVDNVEDLNLSVGGKADAQGDMSLHVIVHSGGGVGGQGLVEDDDGGGVRLFLTRDMGTGFTIHVAAEGSRSDGSWAMARARSADDPIAESSRGYGASIVAASRAMIDAGAEVDAMDGAGTCPAGTGVSAGSVFVGAKGDEGGLALDVGIGVGAEGISESAGANRGMGLVVGNVRGVDALEESDLGLGRRSHLPRGSCGNVGHLGVGHPDVADLRRRLYGPGRRHEDFRRHGMWRRRVDVNMRPRGRNGFWRGGVEDDFVGDEVVFAHDMNGRRGEEEHQGRDGDIDERTDAE